MLENFVLLSPILKCKGNPVLDKMHTCGRSLRPVETGVPILGTEVGVGWQKVLADEDGTWILWSWTTHSSHVPSSCPIAFPPQDLEVRSLSLSQRLNPLILSSRLFWFPAHPQVAFLSFPAPALLASSFIPVLTNIVIRFQESCTAEEFINFSLRLLKNQ